MGPPADDNRRVYLVAAETTVAAHTVSNSRSLGQAPAPDQSRKELERLCAVLARIFQDIRRSRNRGRDTDAKTLAVRVDFPVQREEQGVQMTVSLQVDLIAPRDDIAVPNPELPGFVNLELQVEIVVLAVDSADVSRECRLVVVMVRNRQVRIGIRLLADISARQTARSSQQRDA